MKNKSVILITILFSLMLIGIVMIQAWWISRVGKLNQQSFDAAVYRSLQGVVKQTEEKENFVFIQHQYETDTILKKTKKLLKSHKKGKKIISTSSSNFQFSVDSKDGKETKTVIRIENNENGKKTIHNSVYVGAEAVEIPTPPIPPNLDIELSDTKIEDIEILVEKMSGLKNPDSISLKPIEIEKLIAGQLKQNNLPEKFSFCLLNKNPKKSFVPRDKELGIAYRINLYPNDIFGREVTLVLFFNPGDYKDQMEGWSLPLFLSLFFTLSLLILFVYSIRMLIRHKKMLEQKNDFINHMSHEFKTPLAGISLGADMLIDKPEKMSAEQINKVAHIIRNQSAKLNAEVNAVLLSAQLEENISNAVAPFNLVHAVKSQLENMQLQIENKNAKIETHFSSENISLTGDENMWQKVFSNLIDNALKFSNENPEIKISVSQTNNLVRIEFADNGVGIAEKDLSHIFEKFYRSNYYKQSNIQGFGLGLSFVKKVVDTHRGKIKAESELGKGTKITIEINV